MPIQFREFNRPRGLFALSNERSFRPDQDPWLLSERQNCLDLDFTKRANVESPRSSKLRRVTHLFAPVFTGGAIYFVEVPPLGRSGVVGTEESTTVFPRV